MHLSISLSWEQQQQEPLKAQLDGFAAFVHENGRINTGPAPQEVTATWDYLGFMKTHMNKLSPSLLQFLDLDSFEAYLSLISTKGWDLEAQCCQAERVLTYLTEGPGWGSLIAVEAVAARQQLATIQRELSRSMAEANYSGDGAAAGPQLPCEASHPEGKSEGAASPASSADTPASPRQEVAACQPERGGLQAASAEAAHSLPNQHREAQLGKRQWVTEPMSPNCKPRFGEPENAVPTPEQRRPALVSRASSSHSPAADAISKDGSDVSSADSDASASGAHSLHGPGSSGALVKVNILEDGCESDDFIIDLDD